MSTNPPKSDEGSNNAEQPKDPQDVALFVSNDHVVLISRIHPGFCNSVTQVQTLLQQVQDKFQAMSDQILGRIDEMGNRIDDLEHNLNELMQQAGVQPDDSQHASTSGQGGDAPKG